MHIKHKSVRNSLGYQRGLLFATWRKIIILVFVCCYSASTAFRTAPDDFEILAASAMKSNAASSLKVSFTAHTTTLLEQRAREGVSVAELNAAMVGDAVATNRENSPWHKIATSRPSITFIRHNEEGFSPPHGLRRPPVSSGKVLINVSLEGVAGTPNPDDFVRRRTTTIPRNAKKILIDAVFESNSKNLILITMPTEVWSCPPDNPTFGFCGTHSVFKQIDQTNSVCSADKMRWECSGITLLEKKDIKNLRRTN